VSAVELESGPTLFGPAAVPGVRPPKVVVVTSSYPRHEQDFAGRFVADAVDELRRRGLEVVVVHPNGIGAGGGGLAHTIRRRPWLVPGLFLSLVRAARRAARDADVVHAHWLAGAAVARFAGKPFVVTLHGTGSAGRFADLELAARAPWLVRFLLRPARSVICVSDRLAEAVRACGIEAVMIPNGVKIPSAVTAEDEEPYVLYAGRLAAEKGIRELAEATSGMRLIAAGDGPLRELLPGALGFVPHDELERLYQRAAVVVCSSYREGLPLCVIEAMAFGRPVVATAVGGIPQLVEDGRTGFLVPPGDVPALREALERVLADPALRRRFGRAGRERITTLCSWDVVTDATIDAYDFRPRPRARRLVPRRPVRRATVR
jgi:glycosyltransferase involved in cell wall biosynthesis